MVNNYQAQQFWSDISSVIGFTTSIVVLGFLFGMTRSITKPLGNPNARALLPAKEVKGTCYEDAWRFLIKEGEGGLVHGTIFSVPYTRIMHAWVETRIGFVWEPYSKEFFRLKDFKKINRPIEHARYTCEEATIMVVRAGHYGPWTDEERAKWLPEHHSNEFKFGRRSIRDVLENPKEEEYYVLVTRYYPIEFRRRALKLKETPIAEWDRDLAPSPELLGWWKERSGTPERWEEYTRGFLEEVPPTLIRKKAEVYRERAQERKVVFVCEEEDWEYPYCHTWILLNTLKKG